jgi:carbonic anhydrase
MVSRRLLLGALAGLAAPALAFAEGDGPAKPSLLTRKGRRTRKALKTQASDKAALDKALADLNPKPPVAPVAAAPQADAVSTVSPDEALGRLKQGNAIFVRGGASIALPSTGRLAELAQGQKPFAIVVGCSDSRTAPEMVFDCNLGELFVVRVAGSTVSREGLGSIVYAVEHLGAPLIVVLGHTKCGAVGAAVDVATKHADLHGALFEMVLPIVPAVLEAQAKHPTDLQDAAIRQNARDVAARLRGADGVLAERLGQGRLKIVSACYDLASGQVAFDV